MLTTNYLNESDNIVPRTFPVFSSSSSCPNFGLYCKYQLLKYKPWHTKPDNAWNDQLGTDEIYINSWKAFLKTPFAKDNVPDWSDKLSSCQNHANDNSGDVVPIPEAIEWEEWMHLADLIPGLFVDDGTQERCLPNFVLMQPRKNYFLLLPTVPIIKYE